MQPILSLLSSCSTCFCSLPSRFLISLSLSLFCSLSLKNQLRPNIPQDRGCLQKLDFSHNSASNGKLPSRNRTYGHSVLLTVLRVSAKYNTARLAIFTGVILLGSSFSGPFSHLPFLQ